ncbi:GntR family transcriptional regulator [Anaerocolumna jejuensis DSM 15929]|uniref:GntR family transcriptional regulator n=1 Tax=Anaerocolumna jejuensis DSM 15929 TaxID=1121322 RepID=A0A1M6SNB5_9FIRM|nr:GntR family transcriptional regulator [Anaerocolumna jejuensis]SHK46241.1 GntR family transcriptional regulator [Anaerocolumna jejuensis DSM 15929]
MLQEYRNRPRDEAAEKIESYIAQHNLKPGNKLPSERDMSEMWGINRMTLRGAIQGMIFEGKLYNRKGSGTFVAYPKLNRNLQDLKPFSAAVKEEGKTLQTVLLSREIIESTKQLSGKLCIKLGHPVLAITRKRIVDDEPVMIEVTHMDYERFPKLMDYDFGKESLYHIIENVYGTLITEGTEKLSVTFANEREAGLLEIEEGTPLFNLSGVVKDADGIPIEYFKSVARVDKIRFSSMLTR